MLNPAGESTGEVLRPDFHRRLMLQFRGSAVASDAGLLARRELDDALGLTATVGEMLADGRTGGLHCVVSSLRSKPNHRRFGLQEGLSDKRRFALISQGA